MSKYTIEFTKDFSKNQIKQIEHIVKEELKTLLNIYEETNFNIKFKTMFKADKYLRFSAASDEPKKMWFKINTYCKNMEELITKYLPLSLIHEYHHMIRWNYIDKYNLAELLVMEGLAEHFVIELKQSEIPAYIKPVSSADIDKLLPKIKEDLFDENFNHRIWQRGSDEFNIPPGFAYSYGFHIVKEYFIQNPGARASNSFKVKCKEFLPDYLEVRSIPD